MISNITQFLYLKYNFNNFFEIPKFKKIELTIYLYKNNLNSKQILLLIIFLELISLQKGFIFCNKIKSIYKIKKFYKLTVTLRNQNLFIFLKNFIEQDIRKIFYIDKLFKSFSFDHNGNYIINMENLLFFSKTKNEYKKFNLIFKNKLEIKFFNTSKNKDISKSILNFYLLPIK